MRLQSTIQRTKSWAFHYFHASIFPNIVVTFTLHLLFATLICVLNYFGLKVAVPNLPFFTAVTVVVGLLLVFRTNTAYERYNDGRKLWSQISSATRNFARLVMIEIPETESLQTKYSLSIMVELIRSVKESLRNDARTGYIENSNASPKEISPIEKSDSNGTSTDQTFVIESKQLLTSTEKDPLLKLNQLAKFIALHRAAKTIDAAQAGFLELQLASITDAYSQCQRISRTPIPPAYRIHLQHIVFLYCTLFPFSIVGVFQFWTILISALVFYVILGVNAIGSEIENPFGDDFNDLPLDTFCSLVEREFTVYDQ